MPPGPVSVCLCAISNARPVRALPCKRSLRPRGHKPPRNGELARFSRKKATCPTGPFNRDAPPQNFPGVTDGAGGGRTSSRGLRAVLPGETGRESRPFVPRIGDIVRIGVMARRGEAALRRAGG